jgi:hypothetical protein
VLITLEELRLTRNLLMMGRSTEERKKSMTLVSILVPLALLGLRAYCAIDFARTAESEIRTFTRPVWVLLLVFANVFGGLLWLALGRPPRPSPRR